jgi:transposase-like protein
MTQQAVARRCHRVGHRSHFAHTTVQTCVVHLIQASMRFVSYGDRKKVAAALRRIYTAPTADTAETALLEFADSELGRKYPATVVTWQNAWERFIPFLAFASGGAGAGRGVEHP